MFSRLDWKNNEIIVFAAHEEDPRAAGQWRARSRRGSCVPAARRESRERRKGALPSDINPSRSALLQRGLIVSRSILKAHSAICAAQLSPFYLFLFYKCREELVRIVSYSNNVNAVFADLILPEKRF